MSYFTNQAVSYKDFRPTYPPVLFDWLKEIAVGNTAWDVGCGSGQASAALSRVFDKVIATDTSQSQLDQAPAIPIIDYRCESASASSIESVTVGLTLVAQALHWLDLNAFYAEVKRVSMPGAPLVALTYNLLSIEGIDKEIHHLYFDVLGPYWPAERRHVETAYREITFPFQRIESPAFAMHARWTLEHLIGYLRSWSALDLYEHETGKDGLSDIRESLEKSWGDTTTIKDVAWPLSILAGRCP